jgi:chromosome segregation ATPase
MTGQQIVNIAMRSGETIKSLEDFKNAVSLSDEVTQDQVAGLYALFTALQSANSAIALSSQAYDKQEEASRRSRDQRDAEVDAIEASIDAYNAQDAARLRELDRLDKEAKALNDVTDSLNRLADARLLAAELARDLEITRIGASLTEDESIEREIARQEEAIRRRRQENNTYLSDNFREQERLLLAAGNLRNQLQQLQADPEASAQSIADTRTRLEEANTAANNFIMQFGLGIIANEQELQNLLTSLGILRTELDNLSLENVLGRAKADAQNMAGFRMSNMGLGSSLLGTQDTIVGLAEQVASTDERYGNDVANVLADPEAMKQIYQTANAIEFATMAAEEFSKTGEVIRNSVTDAFVSIIDGSKKAKEAFADMARAILKQIIQMIVKLLVFKAIEAGLNLVTGGTGGTALMALINPSAAGGIMAYANGGIISARDGTEGIVKRPTYLVGEGRYNEAVVPLPNGRAIPVQMHGGGTSQQNNVSVNVNVSNEGQVSTESQGSDMTNLGAVIATAVQKELIAQKMPGGILNRYGVA